MAARKKQNSRLARSFYQQDPVTVARQLLGCTLVHIVDGQRLAGRVVETEAYLGVEDKAAHSYGGRRTARVEPMYADGGTSYVFFTYGMHHCFNVVTQEKNEPTAVLLRALEPTEGITSMQTHRAAARRERDLCNGPAKLCQALGIDRKSNARDLTTDKALWIESASVQTSEDEIVASPRVGIAYAEEWVDKSLRFTLRDHPCVSVKPAIT